MKSAGRINTSYPAGSGTIGRNSCSTERWDLQEAFVFNDAGLGGFLIPSIFSLLSPRVSCAVLLSQILFFPVPLVLDVERRQT